MVSDSGCQTLYVWQKETFILSIKSVWWKKVLTDILFEILYFSVVIHITSSSILLTQLTFFFVLHSCVVYIVEKKWLRENLFLKSSNEYWKYFEKFFLIWVCCLCLGRWCCFVNVDAKRDENELMQEWFNIVHEKNVLVRYESELMVQ